MSDWMSELLKIRDDLTADGNMDIFSHVALQIHELVEQYGWRPVSEPPEKEGWYFVTTNLDGEIEVDVSEYNPLKIGGDHFAMIGVMAWAPMLDPYKCETREGTGQ